MQSMSRSTKIFAAILALYWLGGAHFFMHNPGGSGLSLPFNMIGWGFISLLIGVGLWQITEVKRIRISQSHTLLWLACLLLVVPIFFTQPQWRDLALPRLFGLVGGVLLYFAFLQFRFSREQRLALLYLLLGAIFIEALFALVQYYLLTPGNWIGFDTTLKRPYGIFQQVNVLASFLATGLAIALYLPSFDEKYQLGNWRGWLVSGVLFSTSLLIVVIASRVGHLSALLSFLILWPILLRRSPRLAMFSLLLIVAGISLAYISMHYSGGGRSLDEYQSRGYRQLYWSTCLEMIKQKPWLGWGYGSFEYNFVHFFYGDGHWQPGMIKMEQNLDHPHNETLFWGVEGGLVALAGIAVFLSSFLLSVKRLAGAQRWAVLVLALPILMHTQTEYPLYHSVLHWCVLIFLFWFADEEAQGSAAVDVEFDYWLFFRTFALVIPLCVIVYMGTGLQAGWLITKYERSQMSRPDFLEQVINPLPWLTRFQFDVMTFRLIVALKTNDVKEMDAYLDWGALFNASTPRANVYNNMILLLTQRGDKEKAEVLLQEAKRLYPDDPFFYPEKRPKPVMPPVSAEQKASAARGQQ